MATPVRHYCTLFDKNYMSRGLSLLASLREHSPGAHCYVLCLDDDAHRYLTKLALPHTVLVPIAVLEAADPELAAARLTRSRIEYYFTTTPAWIRYVMATHADIDIITYVDADFWFFASPEPLFDEMRDGSIAIVEHRYPSHLAHLETWGKYNVGWLSFRRDDQGKACLDWWREKCIEWCFDRIEGDRFADQKYLEKWPALYSRLVVLEHPGVSVAPWNLEPGTFSVERGQPFVSGKPLICFHYHGMKHVLGPVYESGLRAFKTPLEPKFKQTLYQPYLDELLGYESELARAGITRGNARSARLSKNAVVDAFWTTANLVGALRKRTYLWAGRT
jgi:hypothetical protein